MHHKHQFTYSFWTNNRKLVSISLVHTTYIYIYIYHVHNVIFKNGSNFSNILLADGGYDSYDAHLVGGLRNRTSFGYSYPDWYSGVADSPAKVAQQLMKFSLRKQRQQYQNRSAPLRLQAGSASTQFTILDEPRFVGYGTVDLSNSREARLSCSFNEAIDQTNVSPD